MNKKITIDGVDYELTSVTKKEPLDFEYHTRLEIHPDTSGKMNWSDAITYVEQLGDGWRLPTITEFYIIYDSDMKKEFNEDDGYWSSSDSPAGGAWYFQFSTGPLSSLRVGAYYDSYDRKLTNYVRAVRDSKTKQK